MANTNILMEISNRFRTVAGPNEFFDFLDGIKSNDFITFGYMEAVPVDYPQKQVYNPVTRRINNTNDFDAFQQNMGFDKKPTGVVVLKVYNLRWAKDETFQNEKNAFQSLRDQLYAKYNVEKHQSRYKTQQNNYGNNTKVKSYNGNNDNLKKHTYTDLNFKNVQFVGSSYYVTFEDGSIMPIDQTKLPIINKAARTAIDRLREAGATEEELAPLKTFEYKRFEHSNILYVSATSKEVPTLYINTRLTNKISGEVDVNPNSLIDIAKDRYSKNVSFFNMAIQESTTPRRNVINITESQIKMIIAESVKQVLTNVYKKQQK